jgi:cobyrinic acid a,c-diamide synthase
VVTDVPRIVIAAPASGSGKTTIATGLMAALTRRGRRVAPFKIGPDYIDPGYHALAAGRPGRNLDPVLVGEHRIGPLFAHGAAGTDVAVIEGVMGLFDGRSTSSGGAGSGSGSVGSFGTDSTSGFVSDYGSASDPDPTSSSGSGSGDLRSAGASGFGSTAHVARLLDAPVVLVVDSRGQGRSLAALLHGFRGYEPGVRLAAVLLNQVGSPRHEQVLREACAEIGLPVLGAVRRGAEVALPSRHLGLIPATEHGEAAQRAVHAMAELISRSVDLDAVGRLAATAGRLTGPAWDANTEIGDACAAATNVATASASARAGAAVSTTAGTVAVGNGVGVSGGPVVAIAGGPAFTFGYAEHLELLRAAGAQVALFDPLRDEVLPEGLAALILPGGFPEQHASTLSANPKLLAEVAMFARKGGILQAECGGLLYLLDQLSGVPMCGVLPGSAEMAPHLVLGYRDAVVASDSAAHRVGERRTGHEFHRTRVLEPDSPDDDAARERQPAWFWRDHDGRAVREGFVLGNVHASYLHTHPAGQPETVARLVLAAQARESRSGGGT